ncbi:MAG TPA: RidA family protein, partial [Candidatus Aphodomonas merdavium]|nr:RidA family protein [Candidatus Aphodomonas merdavium]
DCPGAPMKQQAERLLARYEELLSMYGSSKNHLIFATVYVSDLSQKEAFNAVWDAWLTPGCAPARVCVQCGLPQGYAVEIALTAECL